MTQYEGGVFSVRGYGELNQLVISLSAQGYRIITVFQRFEDYFEIIAQKEV